MMLKCWSYKVSNPFCLTVLAALSEDYTTAQQNLQSIVINLLCLPRTTASGRPCKMPPRQITKCIYLFVKHIQSVSYASDIFIQGMFIIFTISTKIISTDPDCQEFPAILEVIECFELLDQLFCLPRKVD